MNPGTVAATLAALLALLAGACQPPPVGVPIEHPGSGWVCGPPGGTDPNAAPCRYVPPALP